MRRRFLLSLIACLIPQWAFAYDDPHASWSDLESAHFIIHYPSNKDLFARRALAIAEEAHKKLSPLLQWSPPIKTHISVTDLTDEANGWARTTPRNEIRLQAYPPEITEELGFYDDWMRQLLYHEYTHILHTDTSSGLHPILNVIFGKFARNNATTPRWYAEGLAVYYETLTSNTGRLRNSLYKTMLHNAAINHKIPEFGDLSAGRLSWPAESGHYLFGSFFIEFIAQNYGQDSLTRWNHEYGDDWIPYAMNRAALRIWHKTWDTLYDEWQKSAMDDAQKKLANAQNLTPHESIQQPWRHVRPQIHNHSLYYVQNDGIHPKSIVERDMNTGKEKTIAECWGRCEHHWSQNVLYYSHATQKDGYLQYETLYSFDPSTKKIKHLDLPGRVRSFAVDGNMIYRVIQVDESNQIWQTNIKTGEDFCIYSGNPFEQIEDIAVLDGKIAASVFSTEKMQFDLQILSSENTWTTLTDDKSTENSLFWMRSGKLGYISDRSGELNLWAVDPNTSEKTRLTNLIDGIIHPIEDENGDIYYTQYTSEGTTIGRILAENVIAQPENSDSEPLPHVVEYQPLTDYSKHQPRRYKPYQWLWPQTWQPRFSWSESEKASVGIAFNGNDFLDHHAFSFYFDYLTGKDAINFDLTYQWMSLLWNLTFNVGLLQSTAQYRDDLTKKNYDYQTIYGGISAKRVLNGRVWSQSITLGAMINYHEAHDPLSWSKRNPSAMPVWLPSLGWHNAVTAQYVWSSMHQTEKAVVSNDGYTVQANLRFEAPWIGADFYTIQAQMAASAAWTLPWLNHIVSLKLSGGFSWSDAEEYAPFTLTSSTGLSLGAGDTAIHGYPSGLIYGRHFLYGHAAYTLPVWDAEVGHSTLPIGLTRLSLAAYGDWGYAWIDDWDITHSKFALGANVYFDFHLGYRLPVRITAGYAWGGAPYGGHEFYVFWAF